MLDGSVHIAPAQQSGGTLSRRVCVQPQLGLLFCETVRDLIAAQEEMIQREAVIE